MSEVPNEVAIFYDECKREVYRGGLYRKRIRLRPDYRGLIIRYPDLDIIVDRAIEKADPELWLRGDCEQLYHQVGRDHPASPFSYCESYSSRCLHVRNSLRGDQKMWERAVEALGQQRCEDIIKEICQRIERQYMVKDIHDHLVDGIGTMGIPWFSYTVTGKVAKGNFSIDRPDFLPTVEERAEMLIKKYLAELRPGTIVTAKSLTNRIGWEHAKTVSAYEDAHGVDSFVVLAAGFLPKKGAETARAAPNAKKVVHIDL